jgi:two-component system, NtrC family, sensor histidine kinase HydH
VSSTVEVPAPGPVNQSGIWIRRLALAAAAGLLMITLAHYLTGTHEGDLHNLYRRLYYLPIVLLSFAYGRKGGLTAAGMAIALYTPHAFFMEHHDPASNIDKLLEFGLYLGVGALTGWLVDRQRAAQHGLERSLVLRQELEQQLVRAGKLSALGQLTSGLAHEIRNPLASILGAAEALAEDYPEGHRKHRISRLMLREIERLDRVVDDFLAFARPTAARRDSMNAAALAREVIELTSAQARAAGVEVVDQLPATLQIRGDRDQLSQVLLNLTLNAFQALGGVERRRVTFVTHGRHVASQNMRCLGVRDTGPGIPDEHREQIFNPYFTTRQGGAGLGLAISSRIVENHGGFLDLEITDDTTTVWMCLPAEED